jgi:hypothetical protein
MVVFVKDCMDCLVVDAKYLSETDGSGLGWLLTNFQMLWTSKGEDDSEVA